jgi:hypothetical protein
MHVIEFRIFGEIALINISAFKPECTILKWLKLHQVNEFNTIGICDNMGCCFFLVNAVECLFIPRTAAVMLSFVRFVSEIPGATNFFYGEDKYSYVIYLCYPYIL